jgi:hypothetical protein
MTATEWMVLLGGAAAIVWVNWYFFFAGRSALPRAPAELAREEQ